MNVVYISKIKACWRQFSHFHTFATHLRKPVTIKTGLIAVETITMKHKWKAMNK